MRSRSASVAMPMRRGRLPMSVIHRGPRRSIHVGVRGQPSDLARSDSRESARCALKDMLFLLQNLILKDFRIRYRNMSLGVTWSVANPLVMMGILTFVFTRIYRNPTSIISRCSCCARWYLSTFIISASIAGTTSLLDNQSLVKRVPCPRAIFPIASVLSSSLHFLIQIALLMVLLLAFGHSINRYWLWLLPIWAMEIVFMCGFSLITAALDIYYRDIRYLVECSGLLMFWVVPIFYTLEMIPGHLRGSTCSTRSRRSQQSIVR